MTKISEAETAAYSGKNMKDMTRKASMNQDPPHHNYYADIKPHPNAFTSPGLAADVLHDHSGLLTQPAQKYLPKGGLPKNESVGVHHFK
eukprot:CAMPEP_0119010916 /NCGR_PEP_ID=MMETSP1176-20130426/5339_1 /TAXON_ID=265551 /ORGANISM="Synedropsis recta cf, Strain CCMP1620" /LENGTH=88 /DNA_ID=CAMNT_0006963665 /DNA_START=90 /DNA_END=356 /DNA_ORIENTATION=-